MAINYDCSPHFDFVSYYDLQNEPVWLNIDETGLLTGDSTIASIDNVTVSAKNMYGDIVSNIFEVKVTAPLVQNPHRHWRIYINNTVTVDDYLEIKEIEMTDSLGGIDKCISGVVTTNSEDIVNIAAHCFDDNINTFWQSADTIRPFWVAYDFSVPINIVEISMTCSSATSRAPKNFEMQYSDNNVDWLPVKRYIDEINWYDKEKRSFNVALAQPIFSDDMFDIDIYTDTGFIYDTYPHYTQGGVPLTFSLQNAPAWLTIDDTGVISGTSDSIEEVISNITVIGTNSEGSSISNTFSISVTIEVVEFKYWRIFITKSSITTDYVGPYHTHRIANIEMRTTIGGENKCIDGTPYATSACNKGHYMTISEASEWGFDGLLDTFWCANTRAAEWLMYVHVYATEVHEVAITSMAVINDVLYGIEDFTIEYSETGIDWTIAKTVIGEKDWAPSETRIFQF